jgi:hypothetical protein
VAIAESSGYRPAPAPAGGREIDGVYLVPTTDVEKQACSEAAGRLGYSVPCPRLLPASHAPVLNLCSVGFSVQCQYRGTVPAYFSYWTDFQMFQTDLQVPRGYVGQVPNFTRSRLNVVGVGADARARAGELCRSDVGPTPDEEPNSVFWADCGPSWGAYMRWRIAGIVYQVGIDSPSGHRLAWAIYESIEMVAPPS